MQALVLTQPTLMVTAVSTLHLLFTIYIHCNRAVIYTIMQNKQTYNADKLTNSQDKTNSITPCSKDDATAAVAPGHVV